MNKQELSKVDLYHNEETHQFFFNLSTFSGSANKVKDVKNRQKPKFWKYFVLKDILKMNQSNPISVLKNIINA